VPVINDGGYILYESAAILTYLARRFKVPEHWYPQDARLCGLVDQYLHWHHTHLRKGAASLFFYDIIAPLFDESKDFRAEKSLAMADFTSSLQIIEARLAKSLFLAGARVSIADLQAGTEFTQHVLANTFSFEQYPNTMRWLESLRGLPAYNRAHAPLAEIFERIRPRTT